MADHDPGQLTTRQLDRYASQLARCLKALGTDAPIRADVQRELVTVRAEQESRASPASPAVVLQGLA
jgi:aminoglycoside phosphotransferase (APT) family kinase protein